MEILHVALSKPSPQLFTSRFCRELKCLGTLKVVEDGAQIDDSTRCQLMGACDVLITGWGSAAVPASLAQNPGRLRYICHLTCTISGLVPMEVIRAGLPVTNWGQAPAQPVAEGALTLLLACLKQLPEHGAAKRNGRWYPEPRSWVGSLRGLRLGLYGYGAIGRAFHELCHPFKPRVLVFDPYVKTLPPDATRVRNLKQLFTGADAVAIHAALTGETFGSVTAELLAHLPEGGILINTARGEIVDQDALFAELKAHRLRAGLDVLTGNDRLPEGHEALSWPNLILTSHQIYLSNWPPDPERLDPWHQVALDNLRRFSRQMPLLNLLTEEQIARST